MNRRFNRDKPNGESNNKLEAAKQIIITAILPKLTSKDSIGLVLFNKHSHVIQPLTPINLIDLTAFKNEIMKITASGSTYMNVGMSEATNQFTVFFKSNPDRIGNENRIFFLTDATPTNNDDDTTHLLNIMQENQANKIYTTFVGLGVDFNVELVNTLTKIKATNYFSVKSPAEFTQLLDKEFDYIVSADVYDVVVQCVDSGFEVERIFGSPGYELPKSGVIFEINSCYPSLKEDPRSTKGGVVLIKLKPQTSNLNTLKFKISYSDREGKKFEDYQDIRFPEYIGKDIYTGSAVRKTILLTRYVNIMKLCITDLENKAKKPLYIYNGIPFPEIKDKCETLTTPIPYLDAIIKFKDYFTKEADSLSDITLLKELELITVLTHKL